MSSNALPDEMTFWDHLDELRKVLVKGLASIALCTIACFCAKDILFRVVLAPCHADFISYGWLRSLNPWGKGDILDLDFTLINTTLSGQFIAHLETSIGLALVLALPYCLWLILQYILPALYQNEQHFARIMFPFSYAMFMLGILLTYFLLFPVTLHFLGTYQVSVLVQNQITISSYIDSFVSLSVAVGLAFELPVVIWLLKKLGLVSVEMLCRYRKHVLITLMVIAAVITPPDIFTLSIVTIPLYLLYELCILILKIQ